MTSHPRVLVKEFCFMTTRKCCLCGQDIEIKKDKDGNIFWTDGNNPEPLGKSDSDRCCDTCNDTKVIPARMQQMFESR